MFPGTTYSTVRTTRYRSIVPFHNLRILDTSFTFSVLFTCPANPSLFIQPSAFSSTLKSACVSRVGTVSTFSHSGGCQFQTSASRPDSSASFQGHFLPHRLAVWQGPLPSPRWILLPSSPPLLSRPRVRLSSQHLQQLVPSTAAPGPCSRDP